MLVGKRKLAEGQGLSCTYGSEVSFTYQGIVMDHAFPPVRTDVLLPQEGELMTQMSHLPTVLQRVAPAALSSMREGERSAFRIDARLVVNPRDAVADLSPWSDGGFEWIEDSYELVLEVLLNNYMVDFSSAVSAASATSPGTTFATGASVRGPSARVRLPLAQLGVGRSASNGLAMPPLGLGLYMVNPTDAYLTTSMALHLGYRLIDTASMYENEAAVGKALAEHKPKLVPNWVFIVSKVNGPHHGYEEALRACSTSREKLGVDRIDLYLIHSPLGGRVLETWDALLEARRRGWVRFVGVSNFGVEHLRQIQAAGRELPQVNQIEVSPFCQERELRAWCQRHDVRVIGYSPLTRGQRLRHPRVVEIAQRRGRSPAQVLLRWSVQRNVTPIPKTTRRERLLENLQALHFELEPKDLEELDSLEEGLHTCWNCLETPWVG
eukprot:TRINITY_DN23543_c0_g1_i1.p1 TRINITY_DN23543_c0_g1~~TRINITY_DN23543_c0_g1_i1.p1  ORF type:complete len:494 (-),score=85.81 TRINITY_DN23543_c0_g1_i1:376-1689(-)